MCVCVCVCVCVFIFVLLKKKNVMCFDCDYKVISRPNLSQAPEKTLIHNELCCLVISFEEDVFYRTHPFTDPVQNH